MEKEILTRVFCYDDYEDRKQMMFVVDIFIKRAKINFPDCIITKEFYKGRDILVRILEVPDYIIRYNENVEENMKRKISEKQRRTKGFERDRGER